MVHYSPRHQTKHTAAVTMPEGDIRDRKDWPQIEAAIARWDGTQVGVSCLATKFRVPRGIMAGLVKKSQQESKT